jgi:hypothetical protein
MSVDDGYKRSCMMLNIEVFLQAQPATAHSLSITKTFSKSSARTSQGTESL